MFHYFFLTWPGLFPGPGRLLRLSLTWQPCGPPLRSSQHCPPPHGIHFCSPASTTMYATQLPYQDVPPPCQCCHAGGRIEISPRKGGKSPNRLAKIPTKVISLSEKKILNFALKIRQCCFLNSPGFFMARVIANCGNPVLLAFASLASLSFLLLPPCNFCSGLRIHNLLLLLLLLLNLLPALPQLMTAVPNPRTDALGRRAGLQVGTAVPRSWNRKLGGWKPLIYRGTYLPYYYSRTSMTHN